MIKPHYHGAKQQNVSVEIASLTYVSSSGFSMNLCEPLPDLGGVNPAEACAAFGWPKEIKMSGGTCRDLKSLYDTYNASAKHPRATYADIIISIDPNSPSGGEWIDKLIDDLEKVARDVDGAEKYTFLLSSLAATQQAINTHSYSVLPMAVGITGALVFCLVGLSFYSVVVPLRAVISIGLTVGIVYGAAIFVYEDGVLVGLGFPGLMPEEQDKCLSWIPPILCFSILVGLGLDYDIFLISRILEARQEGEDDREAIVTGLTKTGSTITAAGLIMGTAFSGLLFSAEPVLNQISFFLVLAVLVDTFIIRALFVPALMAGLGRINWYPRRFSDSISANMYHEME